MPSNAEAPEKTINKFRIEPQSVYWTQWLSLSTKIEIEKFKKKSGAEEVINAEHIACDLEEFLP